MTPLQIAKQLRRLSKAMVTLGVAMDYHGGFSEIGRHGRDLVNAGLIAKGWATGIEDEHQASKVTDGGTATPNASHEGRTAASSPGVPLDAVVGRRR